MTSADLASAIRELNEMSDKIQEWDEADQQSLESPNDSQVVGT